VAEKEPRGRRLCPAEDIR